MKHDKKLYLWSGVLVFALLAVFLTLNKHSRSGIFNYHSEIWADKAGYYVYLPAALKYDFEANRFPENVDSLTGKGFQLDTAQNKVFTKYSYGVALMQLPFYLVADALAGPLHYPEDGFSAIYQRSIDLAAVCWLLLGLFFLGKCLRYEHSRRTVILTLLALFLATHLFYYAIDDTGMSHVYSFALFCAVLWLFRKTDHFSKLGMTGSLLLGLLSGWILVIRPTGLLFMLTLPFLDLTERGEILPRICVFLRPKILLPLLLGVVILWLPQLFYWRYAHGAYLVYSYGQEGFNWLHPALLQTWFAPAGGLLLYTPLFLLLLGGIFVRIRKQEKNGWPLLALFLLISYVFSCWWDPAFGCSFGGRSYVEYLAVFSLPLAGLFSRLSSAGRLRKGLCILLILLLIGFNLKLIYTFDGCLYGDGAWDWQAWGSLVTGPTK